MEKGPGAVSEEGCGLFGGRHVGVRVRDLQRAFWEQANDLGNQELSSNDFKVQNQGPKPRSKRWVNSKIVVIGDGTQLRWEKEEEEKDNRCQRQFDNDILMLQDERLPFQPSIKISSTSGGDGSFHWDKVR
jgi:hypothetical protein